jgi:chlorite dismutase
MADRSEVTPPLEGAQPGAAAREYLKYTFYRVAQSWRLQPREARAAQKRGFSAELSALCGEYNVRLYSLVGLRGDCDFMTWTIADRAQDLQEVARRVVSTEVGAHLETPYSYLGMRKRSVYLGGHEHAAQDGAGGPGAPVGASFLFVYPFTKKRDWYALPFEERQKIMREHFKVGHKYPKITIHTGYSFGIDDYEFILAFEGDDPGEFLDLVMELRTSEASRYTAVETPIFTCMAAEPEALVAALGD